MLINILKFLLRIIFKILSEKTKYLELTNKLHTDHWYANQITCILKYILLRVYYIHLDKIGFFHRK